jgi:hypothetical protein
MLPFDTLLQPISLERRLYIAASYQFGVLSGEYQQPRNQARLPQDNHPKGIKLGFLSYDFNDHPTAHLVEGLFTTIKQSQSSSSDQFFRDSLSSDLLMYAYCYGNYDNSTFRHKLMEVSFVHRMMCPFAIL